MGTPRTVKGFNSRIAAVKTELEDKTTQLSQVEAGTEDHDTLIGEIAELEVELRVLNDGLAELEKAGGTGDDEDEDGSTKEPSSGAGDNQTQASAKPEPEEVKKEHKVGDVEMVSCTSPDNMMVNPYDHNKRFVGLSWAEVVLDKWIIAQAKAGILRIR